MTSPMKGFMSNIRAFEVSLVKRPANERDFLLTKHNGENSNMDELIQIVQETEAENEEQLVEALKSRGLSDKTIEAVKSIVRLASAYAEDIDVDTFKAVGETLGFSFDSTKANNEPVISKSELKDLPPETQEKIKSLVEKSEEDRQSIDELRTRLDKSEDDAVLKGYVDTCREFKNLPQSAEDLGAMVKSLADADGDAKALLETLRSTDEVAQNADLLGEIGSNRALSGDAIDQVEKLASELAQKDNIDMGRARDKVLRGNKELAGRYLSEQRGS